MKLLDKIERTFEFISRKNLSSKKDPFLKLISKFLSELFDVSYVLIDKYSKKNPDITETVVIYGNGGFMSNLKYNLKFTPCENVIDKELCVYPKNIQEIFPKDELLAQMGVDSYIGMPLWSSNGEPIGLISIMDNKQLKDTKSIEIILQIVAVKVAHELEKEIYENKLELQIQDLKVSKEILEKSEEKYSAVVENSNDGIVIHKEGKIVFANQVVEKVLGIKKNELIGKDILDFVSPDFHEAVIQRNLARYAGEKAPEITEIDLIRKDGTGLPVEINTSIFNYGGEKTSLIFIRNISERRTVENKLIESEDRFHRFAEASTEGIGIAIDGIIQDVNNRLTEMTGYSKEELIDSSMLMIVHPDDQKLVVRNIKAGYEGTYEFRILKKDGNTLHVEAQGTKSTYKGKNARIARIYDISERKRAEETLKSSEERLKIIFDSAPDAIYLIDLKGKCLDVNKAAEEMFGYRKEEVVGINLLKLKFLPVKELIKATKRLIKNIRGKRTGRDEFNLIRKDGSQILVEISAYPVKIKGKTVVLGIARDITERKKAEVALQQRHSELKLLTNELSEKNRMLLESKDRFKNIFDQSPVSLWEEDFSKVKQLLNKKKAKKVDLKTYLDNNPDFVSKCVSNIEVLNVNEITLKLFGVKSREELLTHLKNTNNEKSFDVLKREFLAIASGKKEFKDEAEFISTDGKAITTIIKSAIVDRSGKAIVSIIDITDIKKARKELKFAKREVEKREKKFRELFEKSGDAILIMKNGLFTDCNPAAVELLACKSKNEILNSHPSKLSPEFQPDGMESKVKSKEILALTLKNGTHRFEWMHTKSDGKIFPVEVLLTVISTEPDNEIIHVVWRDITERKKGELKLIEAKEKAEESDRLKTEFLNNMSHEIRTPMNGILGFSHLLNDPNLNKKRRKHFVQIIQNSGNQLLQIIDDILEISRLGTKQVQAIDEEVCLNDLLLELFSIFDIKAKENKTPLFLEKGLLDKESFIFTDRTKLNKIVSNLLENALKFTNKGHISLGYYLKDKEIVIYVKDTGIGIKEELLETIFDRFAQGEKELAKKAGGLGLGLSIAKENTELLGGKISVESEMMEGSTFSITIPYKPVYKVTKIEKDMNNKQKKQLILIAEDEEVNFMFIEILLLEKLKIPCTVLHAINGLEALEICKNNAAIDLVLMDLKMPVMNGFEATKLIKEIRPDLPIIAQSAYSTPEDKNKAFNAGCIDFISKPISKETLKNSIKSFVKDQL